MLAAGAGAHVWKCRCYHDHGGSVCRVPRSERYCALDLVHHDWHCLRVAPFRIADDHSTCVHACDMQLNSVPGCQVLNSISVCKVRLRPEWAGLDYESFSSVILISGGSSEATSEGAEPVAQETSWSWRTRLTRSAASAPTSR